MQAAIHKALLTEHSSLLSPALPTPTPTPSSRPQRYKICWLAGDGTLGARGGPPPDQSLRPLEHCRHPENHSGLRSGECPELSSHVGESRSQAERGLVPEPHNPGPPRALGPWVAQGFGLLV